MAKFQMTEILSDDPVNTARLGPGTGTANNFNDKDNGKLVKYVADSRFDLCAAGDPIEGIVTSVESATLDGYTVGGVQIQNRITVNADGLQATPGTGTILVGDFVVCGTVDARNSAKTLSFAKVCKATFQPGITVPASFADCQSIAKVANYLWRVVSILIGTGVPGDTLVCERINS
jgi:hypothetical protein